MLETTGLGVFETGRSVGRAGLPTNPLAGVSSTLRLRGARRGVSSASSLASRRNAFWRSLAMARERQSSPRNRTCERGIAEAYGEVAANGLFEPGGLLSLGGELPADEGLETLLGMPVAVAGQLVQDGGLAAEALQVVAVEVEDVLLLQQVEALLDVRIFHHVASRVSSMHF